MRGSAHGRDCPDVACDGVLKATIPRHHGQFAPASELVYQCTECGREPDFCPNCDTAHYEPGAVVTVNGTELKYCSDDRCVQSAATRGTLYHDK